MNIPSAFVKNSVVRLFTKISVIEHLQSVLLKTSLDIRLFVRLGHREQYGLLLIYLPLCSVATYLSALLDSVSGLPVAFPRLIVWGYFNLLLWGRGLR